MALTSSIALKGEDSPSGGGPRRSRATRFGWVPVSFPLWVGVARCAGFRPVLPAFRRRLPLPLPASGPRSGGGWCGRCREDAAAFVADVAARVPVSVVPGVAVRAGPGADAEGFGSVVVSAGG